MRFLFVKARLGWPRTYGHDVHGYEMMRALAALGHEVALATDEPPSPQALAGLPLSGRWVLDDVTPDPRPLALSYLQERYRSYWGIPTRRISALKHVVDDWKADVVVVVGLEILPYLAGAGTAQRIWYAADEWVWHYVSQLRADPRGVIDHVKAALIKGFYERAYGPLMDRVWVVSPAERRAMRIVSGATQIDVLPNGVDTDAFAPLPATPAPHSAVFWGRLGFGPNLQALRWFTERVWPLVRRDTPDATFAILGADPPPEIAALDGRDGIVVVANPVDLRPEISRCAVVVMPFVSGGGIKNKFLEAAAMGRPIVTTTQATRGLRTPPPVSCADDPRSFAAAIRALWADPARAHALGQDARTWVLMHHTWRATAMSAVQSIASR
ncbi:MAG: glycosyltransferase family 4 protein [Acidobacteriota bacterium]